MTRVLMVIESLGAGGGAEQALVHLGPELLRQGLEVDVAALWEPYDLAPEFESKGVQVHRLGLSLNDRWNLPRALQRLGAVVYGRRPDILHAHLFFAGVYSGLLPAPLLQLPRVLSLHNVDYDVHPARRRRDRARKAGHAAVLRYRIDQAVAVSRAVAEHYEQHLGLRNIDVIPNSIPTDVVRPGLGADRAQLLRRFGVVDPSAFVAVMPGRLVKQKGHVDLIEAVTLLRASGAAPEVVLVGRGPEEEKLRALIRERGLEQLVHLNGVVPNRELMALFDVADAAVMPSHYEGFGIVAAEAMAMEKPLLATAIGPLMEFVSHEETGLLVPPSNPPALAEGLRRLREDAELRRRLGAAARASIIRGYSVPIVGKRWAETYERIRRRTSQG